jgi:hypothetical protein
MSLYEVPFCTGLITKREGVLAMKRFMHNSIILISACLLLTVYISPVFAQPEDNGEEEPVQARPNPMLKQGATRSMDKASPILMQPSAAQNKAMHKVRPGATQPMDKASPAYKTMPPPSPTANKASPKLMLPAVQGSPAANKATPKLLNPQVQGSQWGAGPAKQVGGSSGDAASGLPTGKRQHKPLQVTKPVDKASPLQQGGQGGFNPDPPPPGKGGFANPFVTKGINPQPEPPGKATQQGIRPGGAVMQEDPEEEPVQAMPSPVQNKAQGFQNPGSIRGFNPQPEPPAMGQQGIKPGGGAKQEDPEEEEPVQAMPTPSQFKSQGMTSPGSERGFNPQPEPPAGPATTPQQGGFAQ